MCSCTFLRIILAGSRYSLTVLGTRFGILRRLEKIAKVLFSKNYKCRNGDFGVQTILCIIILYMSHPLSKINTDGHPDCEICPDY